MDDGVKCCLGIIVIFAIVAVFVFWPHPPDPVNAEIDISSMDADENGTGYVTINCYYYKDNDTSDKEYIRNESVEVNITYENNTTVRYTVTTSYSGDAEIEGLAAGKYNVTARIIDSEEFISNAHTDTVEIGEYVAPDTTSEEDYESEYSTSSSGGYRTYTTTRYYWVYV